MAEWWAAGVAASRMKVAYIERIQIRVVTSHGSWIRRQVGTVSVKTSPDTIMTIRFLLLMAIGFISCGLAKHHRDIGFLNHVQLVHQFRCSLPQPRAVPVEELLSVGPSPDEIFYPASTVLARCGDSGCCPNASQVCAPIETRNVSLVFMVKHLIDRQRDRHHEIIHALEHTRCGCVDSNDAALN
ncbi:uncharacterized protein LOC107264160 [Cephus cinctus]|uniref:Uncharacterized protein LOC107264160 n=1 Tax=Cephus cinctus TaxID=211228 RepID=A0AAJ7FEC4_CEPCN|nr:uncharacterized protein LOC107264160 [Cephus cinctus]